MITAASAAKNSSKPVHGEVEPVSVRNNYYIGPWTVIDTDDGRRATLCARPGGQHFNNRLPSRPRHRCPSLPGESTKTAVRHTIALFRIYDYSTYTTFTFTICRRHGYPLTYKYNKYAQQLSLLTR